MEVFEEVFPGLINTCQHLFLSKLNGFGGRDAALRIKVEDAAECTVHMNSGEKLKYFLSCL